MAGKRLHQKAGFVDNENSSLPVFIGVDVHKRSYHVALFRRDGQRGHFVAPADPLGLIQRIGKLGIEVAMIAYEAGPTGFGLAHALERAELPVLVAAPSRIPRPVAKSAKTDRLDCVKLAEYAAKGMLAPIAVPSPEQQAERGVERRRMSLADSLRKTKQRIKSFLLYHGLAEPRGLESWSTSAIRTLELLDLPGRLGSVLSSMLRELAWFANEIRAVEKELESICEEQEHAAAVARLRSVPGVGLVVASAFRLEVFRAERFAHSGELTSYLGLAPQVRQSGESKGRGRLRPVGQRSLRSLLVEAAWRWKAKDALAEACYRRILGRTGLAQKAIVAVARRLAIILWRLCLEDRMYYPGQVAA